MFETSQAQKLHTSELDRTKSAAKKIGDLESSGAASTPVDSKEKEELLQLQAVTATAHTHQLAHTSFGHVSCHLLPLLWCNTLFCVALHRRCC